MHLTCLTMNPARLLMSEAELHDVIAELEEEEPTGFVRYEKFLPTMTKIMLERKFRPIPEDLLLQAFEVSNALTL
ncbi:dynein regulatory complex protein [Pimephales promelas]|nr:dynein regulatory complex protein [Pimephales promelas]